MDKNINLSRYLFIIPNEDVREKAFDLVKQLFIENGEGEINISKMYQTLMARNNDIVIEIIPCLNEAIRGRKIGSVVISYSYLEYAKETIPYILSLIDYILNVRENYKNKISGLIVTDNILKTLEEILKIEF